MDSAFRTAAYPGYTVAQLREFIANGGENAKMKAEILRREAVASGDYTNATPGERLNAVKEGKL